MTNSRSSAGPRLVSVIHGRLRMTPPAANLVALARERGLHVEVVAYGKDLDGARSSRVEDLETYALAVPLVERLPSRLRAAARWLHLVTWLVRHVLGTGRPSLFIANGLGTQAAVFFVAKLFRIPYAAHVHEVEDGRCLSPLNRLFHSLEGPALRNAALRIFPSARREEYYREKYRLAPSLVSFNCPRRRTATPRDEARRLLGLRTDARVLLYIGGVGAINGILEAVEAVALVSDVLFLVVGWSDPAYKAQLERAVSGAGLQERVRLVGTVEDKWPWLDACDVSLCLFLGDSPRARWNATSSNKITESLAAGAAVLLGPGDDYRDFLLRYPVGKSVEATTAPAIASALRALFADELGRAEMRQVALALHDRELCAETQAAPALAAIERLVRGVDP